MKFLQMFKKKENHTTEEVKLLAKIKNYEKMIQKMVINLISKKLFFLNWILFFTLTVLPEKIPHRQRIR